MELEKLGTIVLWEEKFIIYYLYHDDELVYIGQSGNGLLRPLSHRDKIYNKIVLYKAPSDLTHREAIEMRLINMYRPKYNKSLGGPNNFLSTMHNFNPKLKYINLDRVKDNLKKINRYDITEKIRVLGKKKLHHMIRGGQIFFDYDELRELILNTYSIDISTIN